MKPQFSSIRDYDIITTFDNEQKLKKSYRLGGKEGSNKMTTSLCTMVLHLYPNEKSYLHFNPLYLAKHKEIWWNRIIIEIFDSEKEPCRKRVKSNKWGWARLD